MSQSTFSSESGSLPTSSGKPDSQANPRAPESSAPWTQEMREATYLATVGENGWIKQTPTERQSQFLLQADAPEALFGGAAGGGKSSALLMAALQYVDVPGYSAIIFRKTYSDLALPGALMSRAHEWLSGTAAKWNDTVKTWTFPSGATVTFGYLDNVNDRYRYQSAEFTYVAFDELTQFQESDYLYLFSRLRRLKDSQVPVRMRAASNPGGRGHSWVKKRFLSEEGRRARLFVPAKLADNPFLDQVQYAASLMNLPLFERRQLLEGCWDDFAGNHFHPYQWPRYIDLGDAYSIYRGQRQVVLKSDVWVFIVVDPATSAKASADHTAMLVVGICPGGQMLLLDCVREQMELSDVIPRLVLLCRRWAPSFVGMESVAFQKLLVTEATKHRDIPPCRALTPKGQGKLARAVGAIVAGENGTIYLPDDDVNEVPWLDDFIGELSSFTGMPGEADDQTDCLAYAVLAAVGFRPASSSGPCLFVPGRTEHLSREDMEGIDYEPPSPFIHQDGSRNRTGAHHDPFFLNGPARKGGM